MMLPIEKMSGAAIGRALAAGGLDAVAVTEFFLDRIEKAKSNPVFITVTAERARREAAAAAKRYKEGRTFGLLDGVPVAWKDLMDMAGSRTTAASALYRDAPVKDKDALVVTNLAAAGMVALGKTNLSEFAFSGIGANPHFGTPINPNDTKTARIPGGSTSGGAVAVAAGLAPCSIGSDTGGSVRGPASLNGITGFKTSEGRIDRTGVFMLSRTLDTIGPLAHTVEDCVLLDMALRGQMTTPVHYTDIAGLELVAHDDCADGLGPGVGENMEALLNRLAKAGAKVSRRKLPQIAEARAITAKLGALVTIEAYTEQRHHYESDDAKRMDQRVVSRAKMGATVTAPDLLIIQRERERLIQSLNAELGDALLVTPATPITAPAIAPLDADPDLFRKTNLHVLHFCYIGNYFRMCGLALPSGRDAGGLPTGVQFLAKGGDDERLLSLGLGLERALAS
ncbi:MAG TPA: amidase family protein [Magnetospirillaceae bacterium]|jgi:aspartyl-tRNA(Asn)/glutamyl-tRNA(Gln) amidotransferase subunit A